MIILICKECYEKRYGELPFSFSESEAEEVCCICNEKKRMIDDGNLDPRKNILTLI